MAALVDRVGRTFLLMVLHATVVEYTRPAMQVKETGWTIGREVCTCRGCWRIMVNARIGVGTSVNVAHCSGAVQSLV